MLTLAGFAWMTGDVFALPWLWGSIAEEWTAAIINDLGPSWSFEHDIPRERGNWDHVIVGPPGVFLIDTKRATRPARVANDVLLVGRVQQTGASFRAAAAELAGALAEGAADPGCSQLS
jgi:hypothetical protein